MIDPVEQNRLGTVTRKGHRAMTITSYFTSLASLAFSFAYMAVPRIPNSTILGDIAEHQVWGFLQMAVAVMILVSQYWGGYALRLAHSVAAGILGFYTVSWIITVVVTAVGPRPVTGLFVWPGVAFITLGHVVLSRMQWPSRAEAKERFDR